MRSPFRHVTPDRLQIREGGGCMTIFGLPFFIAGVLLILSAVGLYPIKDADRGPWLLMPLAGVAFTAVGGTLVFGRTWTTIDATRRVVIKQRGLAVPMLTSTQPLDEHAVVRLGFEEGDSDTADRFPVELRAPGRPPTALCRFTQYADSRACAAAVAQHLRIGIEDASTDHATRLAAGEADLPLRDRLRATSVDVVRPPAMRSELRRDADGLRIVMPMPHVNRGMLAWTILPALFGVFLFWPLGRFFRQTSTPDAWGWMFIGAIVFMFALPFSAALRAVLRSRFGRTILTVSYDGVRIAERRILGTRTVSSLPASEIMDVDYTTTASLVAFNKRAIDARIQRRGGNAATLAPGAERILAMLTKYTRGGAAVIIKTRRDLIRVAIGVPDEEVRYLHAVIRRALAGDTPADA